MPAISVFQWRRGTAAQWAAVNPVLAAGEPGLEIDTLLFKVGDGNTVWLSLPYAGTTKISVNNNLIDFPNFSDTAPSPVAGKLNISFGVDAQGNVSGQFSAPYEVPISITGLPGNGQVYTLRVFTSPVRFPINFFGTPIKVGVNPTTASQNLSIKKNGSTIGTLTITSAGVISLTTSGGTIWDFGYADVMTLVAPSPQDATLADIYGTLIGYRIPLDANQGIVLNIIPDIRSATVRLFIHRNHGDFGAKLLPHDFIDAIQLFRGEISTPAILRKRMGPKIGPSISQTTFNATSNVGFGIEMVLNSRPVSKRGSLGPKIGQPASPGFHSQAAFSPEMILGVQGTPPRKALPGGSESQSEGAPVI